MNEASKNESSKETLEPISFMKDQYVKLDPDKILALPHGHFVHRSVIQKYGEEALFKIVDIQPAPDKVAKESGHPDLIHVEVLEAENFVGQTTSFSGNLLSLI